MSPEVMTTVPSNSLGSMPTTRTARRARCRLLVLNSDLDGAAELAHEIGHDGAIRSRSLPRTATRWWRDLGDGVQCVREHAAPARVCSTFGCPTASVPAPAAEPVNGGIGACRHGVSLSAAVSYATRRPGRTGTHSRAEVSPPGLEPELSEPKSEVLPITPRRTVRPRL